MEGLEQWSLTRDMTTKVRKSECLLCGGYRKKR